LSNWRARSGGASHERIRSRALIDRIAEETITGPPPGTSAPGGEELERWRQTDDQKPPSATEHTWRPLDLLELGDKPPEPPAIGGLLYAGHAHVISGEFDAGKSWLLLAIATSELREGRGVVWVDDDDMGPGAILERLRSFELEDDRIRSRFAYLRPSEPLSEAARADLVELIRSRSARLVVFDAFNASLSLHGLDPNSSADVEQFLRLAVRPLCDEGAAVALPDHVVKRGESRGRYSYGSERKQTGMEVHLGLTVLEPFGRGRTGKAKVVVHRDRPGFLKSEPPGLFVLASDPESGRCSWRLEPEHDVSDEGEFRPTKLMEKVSLYLERWNEPASRNQVEQDVQGKGEWVRRAIDVLVSEGYLVEFQGERRARLVKFVRPFRESDEWEAA
jgi:hypothetical protein